LVTWVVGKLALCVVDDHTGHNVTNVNEDFGQNETLPEVHSEQMNQHFIAQYLSVTYGRLISAINSLNKVAPPYAKTQFIKPLILSFRLESFGQFASVLIGPFGVL
jgi:hypothetical protein